MFHDLKQNQLACELDLSKSHISEIENGNRTPSLEVLKKYSDFFKVPVSSIIFFSEQLPDATDRSGHAAKPKPTIAKKIIRFLQVIEEKTELNGS